MTAIKITLLLHPLQANYCSGYGAVRLAYLLWEQGVVGSNPTTPTKEKPRTKVWGFFIGEKRRMLAFVKRSANKKKDRERIERDFLLNTPPKDHPPQADNPGSRKN